MTELDRFIRLAAFDQVRVRFENRVDFFRSGNLLSIHDAAAGLIHDAVSQLAEIRDLFPQRFDGQRLCRSLST